MTRVIVRNFAISFIILALAGSSQAQSLTSEATAQKPAPVNQQDARIESLLIQLADQARMLDDLAFSVHAQMQAATLLWPRDRERARAIYRRAFDSLQPSKLNEGAQRESSRRAFTAAERQQLRGELLNEIANRDPELIEEITRALADSIVAKEDCPMSDCEQSTQPKLALNAQSSMDSEQRELLVSVALQIVERSPQRAMALAQLSMVAGISPNLTRLLLLMQGADASLADLLFAGALSRLEPMAIVSLSDLHALGSYLIAVVSLPDGRLIDKATVTRFLGLALKQIARRSERAMASVERMSREESDALYFVGRQLTELFKRYLPNRLEDLQRCIAELSDAVPTVRMIEQAEASAEASKESASEITVADDDRERDRSNAKAAIAHLAKGETPDALKAALKISNADIRDRVLAQLARRELAAGAIEDAAWVARRIDDVSSRADAMVMVATALLAAKDRQRAAELLNEAEGYLTKTRATTARAHSLLKVGGAFSSFEPARSFEVMQSAIRMMNEAARQEQSKQETTLVAAQKSNSFDELFDHDFERALSALARVDFDRALALAEQLSDKEASILAQLAVCRGGLATKPQPEQTSSDDEAGVLINHF